MAVDQKFGVLQRIVTDDLHCTIKQPRVVARTIVEVEACQSLNATIRRFAALKQSIQAKDGANACRFSGGPILGVNEIADGNGVGD